MAIDLVKVSWTDKGMTIDLRTTIQGSIALPIVLSGFKDFGGSRSEFQQMVQSDKATGTVRLSEHREDA
jgi:hypothetical protein